jgi:Spy/CpxP family protein refolding chaperone
MKRRTLIVALSATAIVLVAGLFAGHWASAQMYGGHGPGMMSGDGFDGPGWGVRHGDWGGGPGMMRGGPGGGGGSDEFGAHSQLPTDKRAQLRDLSVDTQRKMVGQQAAMEELMLTYSAAVRKFPVDREAATKAWQGMDSIRKQMFDLRLESMSKAQQILGKDLWEKAQDGWGPGRGAPRGP